jgi:phosphate transport system ATP-binding protein
MSEIELKELSLSFGNHQVLRAVSFDVKKNDVVALIGPSGCGKSTLLKCINRMHDHNADASIKGEVFLEGKNVYGNETNVHELRRQIGMVFQKPNPFPKSVRENIEFGLKINGFRGKKERNSRIVESLKDAYLWNEVKDKLEESALSLSGGQQQRLCIARCIAISPRVILMDEPTSALDPMATQKIEDLILKLRHEYTIIIVTHNMQQARRISNKVAMLYLGDLIEFTDTEQFFSNPQHELARNYVTGEFG